MDLKTGNIQTVLKLVCDEFGISEDDFKLGKNYKCSDARKVAIAVLLDLGISTSITDAAFALNIRRNTASIALKTLNECLPYDRVLDAKYKHVQQMALKRKRTTPTE